MSDELQMITITEYKVRRPFKYDGKWLKVGQPWEPKGGRWDRQIINTRQVSINTRQVKALFEEPEATSYEEMTVAQLRDLLKSLELKVGGKKAELIERLQEYNTAQVTKPVEDGDDDDVTEDDSENPESDVVTDDTEVVDSSPEEDGLEEPVEDGDDDAS